MDSPLCETYCSRFLPRHHVPLTPCHMLLFSLARSAHRRLPALYGKALRVPREMCGRGAVFY